MSRRLASPEAETRSYWPPPPPPLACMSVNISFELPASLRWMMQPVCFRNGERSDDGGHDDCCRHLSPANPPHVPSFAISYVCSGRHERRTRLPCSESASC